MDENKNLENLEENEALEEVSEKAEAIEEIAEEAAEAIEENVEAVIDEAAEVVEEAVETLEAADAEPVEIKKGSKVGAIVAVVLAIVVVAAAVITSNMEFNKYNKLGYVDISGRTVQDLLDAQGMELEEFLTMYELPADMPADTTEAAAYYCIPVKKIAEMYGMDFATMKETLKIPETVTENTPWGEAEGEIALADYVGAENIESFKSQYGLGDEITAETKWKEIRNTVDNVQKEQREAQEKAAEEAAKKAAEEAANAETETEDIEAPAEGEDVPAEGEKDAE